MTKPNPAPFALHEEAEAISLLSNSTRWRQEKQGRFPKRIKLSDRKAAYLRSELEDWARDPEGWRARNASQRAAS